MGVAKMIIRPILPIALLLIIFAALIACTFWGVIRTSLKRKEKIFTALRLGIIYVLVLIIGLRPMTTDEEYEFSTRNLDVIFVVDTTISMWATDYHDGGSRIEGAKRDAKQIVDELAGSNFALMTFDDQSHVISPCTQDMEHVKTLLDTLAPPGYEYAGGSDMSLPYKDLESLLLSSSRKENRKSIVIFMSDGEITNGKALRDFTELGQYVDAGAVLGYGTTAGGKMKKSYGSGYLYDYNTHKDAVSMIDEENLKKIAEGLGVEYMNMNNGNSSLVGSVELIKESSKTIIESGDGAEVRKDMYFYLAYPLMIMILIEIILVSRRGRM